MGLTVYSNKAVPLCKRKVKAMEVDAEDRHQELVRKPSVLNVRAIYPKVDQLQGLDATISLRPWWRVSCGAYPTEETFNPEWASEEAFVKESKEDSPGTEWEKVAQLCDFNPKSSKQCKDVSRLRSVLMSLKQTPLSR